MSIRRCLVGLVAGLLFASSFVATADAETVTSLQFSYAFGSPGSGNGQFNFPVAAAVSPITGNLFVADFSNNRVQVFDKSGTFLRSFGTYGIGDGQLKGAAGVVVDSLGNVCVTDHYNGRIVVFGEDGTFRTTFGQWGMGKPGLLHDPWQLSVDNANNIYVADQSNCLIQVFGPGPGFAFKSYVGTIGQLGNLPGQFHNPLDVQVDSEGNMFVADTDNYRIQVIDSLGQYQFEFGSSAWGIALDNFGNVFVADKSNHRVQVYDKAGHFVSSFGTAGTGDGQFNAPYDVAVDNLGHLFVVDTYNSRIQVLTYNIVPAPTAGVGLVSVGLVGALGYLWRRRRRGQ